MKISYFVLWTFCIFYFSGAYANTPSSSEAAATAGSSTATTQPSEKSTDEADAVITNRMLRASTGSLSKWSLSSSWSYSAGSLSDPFNAVRPNITSASDTPALQSLSGTVGAKYRIDATNSLSMSTGMNMLTPFHRSLHSNNAAVQRQFDASGGQLNVNDPSLSYTHLSRWNGIQNVSSFDTNLLTSGFFREAGYRASLEASHQFMYEVKKANGLSVGLLLTGTKYFFDKDSYTDSTGAAVSLFSDQASLVLGAYPAVEYVISDRLNFRTISGIGVYEFRRDGTSHHRIIYQSMGLGISVTRDFFLYPNIQFIPGSLRANNTNLGLNANINLF